ncbi:MAG TPA: ABC transporter permease [Thermoplasmata archaeon]|nr:ABC transporter permease [Thermoplasmata archaeon]
MATALAPANRASFWRTLWTNAVFAPRTSLGFMRIDFVLGTVFIIPFTQMLFFAFVAQLASTTAAQAAAQIAYVAVGNAVATVTYSSIFSVCQTTDHEKNNGTMEHLLVSPTNRFALYFGRGLVPILVSLATVAVGLTYAIAVFGAPFSVGAIVPVTISVVLAAFSMVGFGLLLGGVALYLRTSIVLGNIFLFLGLLLSGTNFPASQLPVPLQIVGDGLPLTWATSAVRASLSAAAPSVLYLDWAAVAIAGLVSYAMAIVLWRIFERRALATGSIARF